MRTRAAQFLLLSCVFLVCGSEVAADDEPCIELKEFGCEPWVTCMPVEGGWKYIRR